MHRLTALPAAACIAFLGCFPATASPLDSLGETDGVGLYGHRYSSVQVDGEQIPGGGPLVLVFDVGRLVMAYAGCNKANGPLVIDDLLDGVLSTTLRSTMMACAPPHDQTDAWMTKFFDARPAWSLDGENLTLTTPDTTMLLRQEGGRR